MACTSRSLSSRNVSPLISTSSPVWGRNRILSPGFTFLVSGPIRTTSDHSHRFMWGAAVAGITRPALDRRSVSSGTRMRMRSAVRRIRSEVSGSPTVSIADTGRSLGLRPAIPRNCRGQSAFVEKIGGDPGPELATPSHERGDPECPFVEAMQRVLPGEPDPAVGLDGPLAYGHGCFRRPGLGRGGGPSGLRLSLRHCPRSPD